VEIGVLNNLLYAIGEHDGVSYFNSVLNGKNQNENIY
jgi:hypothetical protein